MIADTTESGPEDVERARLAAKYATHPESHITNASDKGVAIMALCEVAGVPYRPEDYRSMVDNRVPARLLHAVVWGVWYQCMAGDLTDEEHDFCRSYVARYAPGDYGPGSVPKAGTDWRDEQ